MQSTSTCSGSINNPTTGTHPCVVNKVSATGVIIAQLANVPGHGSTGSFTTSIAAGEKIVLASADVSTPPTVSLSGTVSAAASALVRTEPASGTSSDSEVADSGPGTDVSWTAVLTKQGDAVQLLGV